MGSGRGDRPPSRARGAGPLHPARAPLAAAPGAGRGCQMLGRRRRRRRDLRRARSHGTRQRVRAPLAGPPGPLRTAPARVSRGTGRAGGSSGTGMHCTRLDSFLGQLRWELVRLGSGVTCKDTCGGVLGCGPARTTREWGGRPECSSKAGWGRGGTDGPDGPRRVSDGWELQGASSNNRPAGRAAGAAKGAGVRGWGRETSRVERWTSRD